MGFLDRFKKGDEAEPPAVDQPEPWDGGAVDWAAAGVSAGAVELAAELADSDDFGVDPSEEDGCRWSVALFDDVRGLVGDPAIEALPAWLETFDDLDAAESFDREIIEVRGSVERHDLAVRIVARLAATADRAYWDDAD